MIRAFIRSLIQNATVTHADTNAPACIRVDEVLLRAAEILPLEVVEVVNLATGERFRTWVEPVEAGSGTVRVHSGVQHPVRQGDVISIVCSGLLHDGQTLNHRARIVTVDEKNVVVAISETT